VLEDQADEVLCNLSLMVDGDYMPMEVADRVIRNSAYWYGHPQGPARAPKHAERLTQGDTGWELVFGANTFLVETAVRRCVRTIEKAAEAVKKTDKPINENALARDLAYAVQGAVANYQGLEYSGFYDASDGFMHFGTQAIHVPSFVATICDEAQSYLLASEIT
jgi:hypothetical protein